MLFSVVTLSTLYFEWFNHYSVSIQRAVDGFTV